MGKETDPFYGTDAWKRARGRALERDHYFCVKCRKAGRKITLENGLRLQLGVSGDTLMGCGGWSCPEFFDAFEAAL